MLRLIPCARSHYTEPPLAFDGAIILKCVKEVTFLSCDYGFHIYFPTKSCPHN